MVTRLTEEAIEARIGEFAGRFGDENAIKSRIAELKEKYYVGRDVILPVMNLVESSFVDNKPSNLSNGILSDAATIIKNVVEGIQDRRGSSAVLQFVDMATAIARRPEQRACELSNVQADIVSGMAEFTCNLLARNKFTQDDVHSIFESATELLDIYLRQGRIEDAVDMAKNIMPNIPKSRAPEWVRPTIEEHWTTAHSILREDVPGVNS